MTVLFVWWVSPQQNQGRLLWQEIAVEEDWASCWVGLLAALYLLTPTTLFLILSIGLSLSYPLTLSLALSPNCPL